VEQAKGKAQKPAAGKARERFRKRPRGGGTFGVSWPAVGGLRKDALVQAHVSGIETKMNNAITHNVRSAASKGGRRFFR